MSNSKVEVTGILDQTTQSMIVMFLRAGILWHVFMTMPVSVLEHSIRSHEALPNDHGRAFRPSCRRSTKSGAANARTKQHGLASEYRRARKNPGFAGVCCILRPSATGESGG